MSESVFAALCAGIATERVIAVAVSLRGLRNALDIVRPRPDRRLSRHSRFNDFLLC